MRFYLFQDFSGQKAMALCTWFHFWSLTPCSGVGAGLPAVLAVREGCKEQKKWCLMAACCFLAFFRFEVIQHLESGHRFIICPVSLGWVL